MPIVAFIIGRATLASCSILRNEGPTRYLRIAAAVLVLWVVACDGQDFPEFWKATWDYGEGRLALDLPITTGFLDVEKDEGEIYTQFGNVLKYREAGGFLRRMTPTDAKETLPERRRPSERTHTGSKT